MSPPNILQVYTQTPLGRVSVFLRDIRPAGRLANGATEYHASVTYWREDEFLGDGRWEGEGLEAPVPQVLPDTDASDAAIHRLEREVRAALAQY